MPTVSNDSRSKPSRVGNNRWTRVREAYQSGELDRQNIIFQPERKRSRRNALADISAVSTNADASSQKHQFHQLVERVRELQKEIVPDLLLYQMPPNYSPFSAVTPGSNASRGSISLYPRQQSISMSSGSSNSSIPNQRFSLSSRILERAHQIPERFWIDWQQKQMQDRIEELEYIKNNMDFSSNSSLLSNEADENGINPSIVNRPNNYDAIRRESLLFLHQAQRLANERRASLARTATIDASIPKEIKKTSNLSDNDDHSSFNFDQRSEETNDTANLNDLIELPPKPITPPPPVQQSQPTRDHSRSPISLPFTYINTHEQTRFPNNYRQIYVEPMLEKVIEVSDEAIQTTSPTNSIEDVAQIDTEFNLTLLKREHATQVCPLLYSKATVNRRIEFHKFRPISPRNTTTSSKKDTTIHISIYKRKEIGDSRSTSPALSFKSARSRFSPIDNSYDLDDDIQSSSVLPSSSLSVSSRSRSTSSHIISTIAQCYDHNYNNYPSLKQESSDKCTCFIEDRSMSNIYSLEQKYNFSSCSSCSSGSFEGENNLPISHTLFTCRHRQRGRKKKGNTSNLSLVSTPSSKNNLPLLRDLLSQIKENDNNNNKSNTKRTLKLAHNTSIISNKRTREWKHKDGGFQRDVLTNDNNDNDDHINRSSSSSAAAAADFLIRRQRRKQTSLKRKTGSEKRKEKKKKKKKKKERNKKSTSSTAEAEASLFQIFAVDTSTIDTSAIFYPYEQAKCADKSTAKQENYFSIQTSGEHHNQLPKQKSKINLIMADGHGYTTPNTTSKKKENVRVFVRRRRRTTKHQKRVFRHSSSSNNSHETISSSSTTNVEELISLIQQQINNKQKKSQNNKNIIVVNYKPVFVNSRQQKSTQTSKSSPISIPKPKFVPTDDEFSSATHYSRRRSLTTTSSDGSPLRSTANRSHLQQSVSLDVPDVEDPLMFIEMMYQQLFTEDGRLRSGTEPTVLENCVKQIVTNSRRNSISSSIANGSTSSHLKHRNSNTTHQQRKFSTSSYHPLTPSKPISLSSSPCVIPNEHYNTFSEEEEEDEEPKTLVQTNSQRQTVKTNTDISGRSSKRLGVDNLDNHSQIHAFLNSCHQKRISTNRTMTMNNGFQFSIDDTDNEDLDTFSDLNSIRYNNKTIRTSPSVDEDLTHTDSRLLSSSGYQSLDRSRKSIQQQKSILSKSHSENDLSHSSHKNDTEIKCIHYCSNCIRSPNITVIPSLIPTSLSNIIQRIQQPVGIMLMKYLHFILISKNVLLLPLFIFLLRQRSMHIGN